MRVRILDFDGSLPPQRELQRRFVPTTFDLSDWAPRIRMGCGWRRFQRFEQNLNCRFGDDPGDEAGTEPVVTLYGSGDFHHVSLALLRRLRTPFNLLIIDNHPDWMRGVPFLHCGTWVYHAASLPNVRTIFHVGGNDDFDDAFRWLAPWPMLRSGKIRVFPAVRRFQGGSWSDVPSQPLRLDTQRWLLPERVQYLLQPHREELARLPLYVSLDKDAMIEADAVTNWPAGKLLLSEVQIALETFLGLAGGQLLGMDILGDWSPVRLQGLLRHFLHHTEHEAFAPDPIAATHQNERANLALMETVRTAAQPPASHFRPRASHIVTSAT